MFEVGKLSDESLDSFLSELEKVRNKSRFFMSTDWMIRGILFLSCVCQAVVNFNLRYNF